MLCAGQAENYCLQPLFSVSCVYIYIAIHRASERYSYKQTQTTPFYFTTYVDIKYGVAQAASVETYPLSVVA